MKPSRFDSDLGPFAIVPGWLLAANVSDRAVRVFAVLAVKYADREGRAFPSRQRLALDMGASVDSVDRAVAELVKVAALTVERRQGPKGDWTSNEYRLRYAAPVVVRIETVASDDDGGSRTGAATLAAGVRPPSRTGAATPSRTGAATRTSTSLEGSEPDPPIQETRALHARFLAFRNAWPKGYWTGHEAALKVWEKLRPDETLSAQIMASLEAHKARHPKWRPDPRSGEVFIPNPRTWLNQRRWLDDVGVPVQAERRSSEQAVRRPPVDPALVDRVLADPVLSKMVDEQIESSLHPYRGRMSQAQLEAQRTSESVRRGVAEGFIGRLKPTSEVG